jgi:Chaperone of endosialidase
MKSIIQVKTAAPPLFITLALLCFRHLPNAQAVVPPPDGGYANFTTAEGTNALKNLVSGAGNTAVGWFSLFSDATGSFNTGVGAGTLVLNTADSNTAIGTAALLFNNTGSENTAVGTAALLDNTIGFQNTAVGTQALHDNTIGTHNTATGYEALFHNTNIGGSAGGDNTADGFEALFNNTIGFFNTADGSGALFNNTIGNNNTAVGTAALLDNTDGNDNTAVGFHALFHSTGSDNVALGRDAGFSATTGSNNVYIGAGVMGAAGESNVCYIASIFAQTSASGIPVFINGSNKLGTTTSSKRFKEGIKPMDKASEALYALKPVSFRYNKEIDPTGIAQLGLVAEDVEKVNPDLIVRDQEGKAYSVRYDQVNAMLLNEFLKEHKQVQDLKAALEAVNARLKAQEAKIEKVSAQLKASTATPQIVSNQ